ncbi:hypothetical protein DFP72DRAFT_1062964 [Ephemerocybe angulata]|uniref:Uncharacterized protein n=1 Tax=Ephemerocybe angulata TaxID=980116 RepID=A0A8H6I7Y2_9AGAR|nr:hypothetical protein DFP72DRAFT_1062964 [Tulosesus angulatus]
MLTGTVLTTLLYLSLVGSLTNAVLAGPAKRLLDARASPDNTVLIEGPENFCLIVPKASYTDIGDSERPGGTTTYCTRAAIYDSKQGELSPDFWTNVEHYVGSGVNGGRYTQLTGCINPSTLDRLNSDDDGGQYDSSGGSFGTGNPEGSVCLGYNHYIELIEPSSPRACIRCCEDAEDCPTQADKDGCPAVVPGNYFDCD